MFKINKEQLARLAYHNASANKILTDVLLNGAIKENPESIGDCIDSFPLPADFPFNDEPMHPVNPALDLFGATEYEMRQKLRRAAALEPLCGRWTIGDHRCGIEITRAGEHYILTYLKKNGRPTDQRYLLLWWDGDIAYYDPCQRIVSVALNTETDTLIVSPGLDYSRIPEVKR